MDLQLLRNFFMWCVILNAVLLLLTIILWISLRDFIYGMHSRWFDIDQKTFDTIFYSFIGLYKILIFVFALVPWVALVIKT